MYKNGSNLKRIKFLRQHRLLLVTVGNSIWTGWKVWMHFYKNCIILAQQRIYCQKRSYVKKNTFKNILKLSNYIVWIITNICCCIFQISLLMYRYGLNKFLCPSPWKCRNSGYISVLSELFHNGPNTQKAKQSQIGKI